MGRPPFVRPRGIHRGGGGPGAASAEVKRYPRRIVSAECEDLDESPA